MKDSGQSAITNKKKEGTCVERFCDFEQRCFKIRFLTPAFLGGASGNAELRAASFKGMIRYWWRVLYGSTYGENISSYEKTIFGSTENSSLIRIVVTGTVNTSTRAFEKGETLEVFSSRVSHPFYINILDYLAYGKYERPPANKGVFTDSYIIPGEEFLITISCKKQYATEVFQSFWALINYGGIGAKWRNGFGSMEICSADKLEKNIKKWIFSNTLMPYTALSKKVRMFETEETYTTWEGALSEIGLIYHDIRTNIEQSHHYEKRGLIARPIIAKHETIPLDVQNDRVPKFVVMSVSKDGHSHYYGRFILFPVSFYQQDKQALYNKTFSYVAEKLHNCELLYPVADFPPKEAENE